MCPSIKFDSRAESFLRKASIYKISFIFCSNSGRSPISLEMRLMMLILIMMMMMMENKGYYVMITMM